MRVILILTSCCIICLRLRSQDTVQLSLQEVLRMAEANYPRLQANAYELQASKANIQLQQQSIIPQLDASYQANLATHNNLSGMYYSQYILPISGPPSASNDYSPVTGSAASLLLQWQPGIFGEHKSKINTATAAMQTQASKNAEAIFSQKVKVSYQYIDVLYFQRLLRLYQENMWISEEQLRQVKVLAVTGLRPGVDTALIQAELSRTRIEWLKIRNEFSGFLSALRESLSTDSVVLNRDSLFYTSIPVQQVSDSMEHPLIKLARQRIEENKIKNIAISRLTAPHLSFWGTGYARGSGINYNGNIKTWDGLGLQRFNYGAGVQIAVPLLKYAEVKTRMQQQDWLIKSEVAQLDQVTRQLKEGRILAETTFSNALAIVKETPVQVHAADYAFRSMQIRYSNGLVNYTELLQTQSALLKAKIELTKSQAELWKALLYKAAVNGDLNLFVNQVK